ncbi:MAG TPA: NAD(P)-dependent oxidoreductase [Gemmataceae bacterium]|nr:NAD(P)-dependent oxidoreductase [Gemmataceae bacterium]
MRVLLTGGYGCIGSWILKHLLHHGESVWIYDLREDTRRLRLLVSDELVRKVDFIQGDVTDLAAVRRAIDRYAITHVLHLAGLQVPICRAEPLHGAKVNVLGTLAIFEAVRLARPQVQRLVYASSAAVFGPPDFYAGDRLPLSDDVLLAPSTHYGVFKCCNEGNARIYYQDFGLSSIGLRPWTVYGVGRDFGMTSEPTKAIKSVALGRPYAISYGGKQDLQFADDVAKVFVQALEVPYRGAKSYNLRGAVVDLATFHRTLCEVAPEARDLIAFGERQLGIAYDLSDTALQRDLGPIHVTPLADGIRQTLEDFRRLQREGRLDTAELDAAPAPATAPADEP